MPIINISVARGHTAEQLHKLMAGISQATGQTLEDKRKQP